MSSTLLQLVGQATAELGLSVPTSVIGNTQQDVVQQLGLTQAVIYELQREWQWQALTKEYRFTTTFFTYTGDTTLGSTSVINMSSIVGLSSNFMVVGTGINQDTYVVTAVGTTVTLSQAAAATATAASLTFSQTKYSMPSDYDRLIDRTDWDKSKHWEMLGPETAQQWQWLKSGYISTGPRVRYRVLGDFFQVWPPLGSNEYLGFEYVSNLCVALSSGATPTKTAFTLDTDTCIFPDRLMVLGLKKKYFEIKGFDTIALTDDYNRHLSIAKAADAGSPTLSMAPRLSSVLIGWENIPDSGYGT